MANLLLDDSGRPKPQVENTAGTGFEAWKGENNAGRITGDVDHDAVDAGKPVKVGGKAADPVALPADVAAGDRVNALFDLKGRLFIRQDQPLPAGANIIGKVAIDQTTPGTTNGVQVVAALPAGDNNIGNVDVVSSVLPTGAATEVKQDAIIGYIDTLETLLTAIKTTDGIKKIADPLPERTYSCAYITASSQVKAGAGRLKRIIVGKVSTAGDLTVYDNTAASGTIVAQLGLEVGGVRPVEFDVAFTTGLYISFDAGLAGSVTVIYE